jgi:quercetin dioxygenase-like cupin family protein
MEFHSSGRPRKSMLERNGLRFFLGCALLLICMAMADTHSRAQPSGQQSSRMAFTHALPALNGDKLTVNVVEVTYAPGEGSPPHSHPCPVVGYVAEGEIRSQVQGQPEAVYKAGDSFYEAPNGVHAVSANASQTKPAKLIAFFVCDHAAPLSAPAERTHK